MLGRTLLQLVITTTTTSYYLVTVVRSITNFAWCNFSLVAWRKSSKHRRRQDNQGKKKRRNSLLPSLLSPALPRRGFGLKCNHGPRPKLELLLLLPVTEWSRAWGGKRKSRKAISSPGIEEKGIQNRSTRGFPTLFPPLSRP